MEYLVLCLLSIVYCPSIVYHMSFSLKEERMRYRLILKSAQNVADYNEDKIDTAHYVVYFFSVMTKEE